MMGWQFVSASCPTRAHMSDVWGAVVFACPTSSLARDMAVQGSGNNLANTTFHHFPSTPLPGDPIDMEQPKTPPMRCAVPRPFCCSEVTAAPKRPSEANGLRLHVPAGKVGRIEKGGSLSPHG